jgi:signal peptidase I
MKTSSKRKSTQSAALSPRKLRKRAKEALGVGRWIAKRRKKKLDPAAAEELQAANTALAAALKSKNQEAIKRDGERLSELLQGKLKPLRPNEIWLNLKWMLIFAGIALFFRLVFFELFSIPSGSMLPTLQVGDRVVVSKFAYGLRVPLTFLPPKKLWRGRDPRRGEVVVFMHPNEPERDMVKRVIAIGGDEVRFREGRIWIRRKGEKDFAPIPRTPKGELVQCDKNELAVDWTVLKQPAFEEHHGDATYIALGASEPPPKGFGDALASTRRHTDAQVTATEDTFGPIPDGHAFMVGDNREFSMDSRFWGTVPYDYLKGPALFDLFSYGASTDSDCRDTGVRWRRTFKPID